ncbi:MAG: OmpA family protein [Alphaproteobacteria bacterium]
MPSSHPPEVEKSDADEESDDKVDRGTKDEHADDADGEGKVKDSKAKDGDSGTGESNKNLSEAFLRQLEDRKFRKAETAIKKRIEAIPGLSALGNNLIFDHTQHGLRIQLIDSQKKSMFSKGSSVPYQHTRQILEVVSQAITKLPNKVFLSGHTDSITYARGASYSNWELSTDRANASRRALVRYGVHKSRITHVTGKAETEPLLSKDPTNARNHQISITLVREARIPPKAATRKKVTKVKKVKKVEKPKRVEKAPPPPPIIRGSKFKSVIKEKPKSR